MNGPSRYRALPLFALFLAFIAAAPVYWARVETRPDAIAESYQNRVLYQQVFPALHYGFSRLREGELPLWNPRQLCGTPFFADWRNALLEPTHAVFLLGSTERAMALHAFACLSLMGIGFVLFGRALGFNYVACLLGGVVYAFSGTAASAMAHPSLAAAMAWTPFLFWILRELRRTPRLLLSLASGLVLTALILCGSAAALTVVLLAAVPYALLAQRLRDPALEPSSPTFHRSLLIAALLALGLSAVQWLPTLVWLTRLDAPAPLLWNADMQTAAPRSLRDFPFHLLGTSTPALPRLLYFGVIPLLLLPIGFFARTARKDTLFFGAVLAGSAVLAILPQPFQFPAHMFALPAALAASVLTAAAAERLLMPAAAQRALPRKGLVAGTALWWFALAGAAAGQGRGYLLVAAAAALPALVFGKRTLGAITVAILSVLAFSDLYGANVNRYSHPFQDAPGCYTRYQDSLTVAGDTAQEGRLFLLPNDLDTGLIANLGMLFPMDVAGGEGLPLTREQALWWQALRPGADEAASGPPPGVSRVRALDAMAVRVVIEGPRSPAEAIRWLGEADAFAQRPPHGEVRLFERKTPPTRATWVGRWRWVKGGAENAILEAQHPGARPAEEAILFAEGPGGAEKLNATPQDSPTTGKCAVVRDLPEEILLDVEANEPGIVVLADTWAQGWHATLDGERTPILRVNGLFRGVFVPQGPHRLRFVYSPWEIWAGSLLSLSTFLTAALLAARGLKSFR